MKDITYARPRVRGPKLLLTAAVAVTLAIGMLAMAGSTANAGGNGNGNPAPALGAADSFAVLSALGTGGAVTCTNTPAPTVITGDVGTSGTPPSSGSVTNTGCTINGNIVTPATAALAAFNSAYAALGGCGGTVLTGTLARTLGPGVYCFDAAVATTDGTLTLTGNGPWLFKIGTLGTGYLTGTRFNVVFSNPNANPCDVTWRVAQYAELTDSNFVGTILAGMYITSTRGTFHGRAFAKAAVTITGGTFTGCTGGTIAGGGKDKDKDKDKHEACNQGVGNGPEGCDPGNSNQGDEDRSNDENGGTPGHPGRQGGNDKND
jgi:hypothetical protein